MFDAQAIHSYELLSEAQSNHAEARKKTERDTGSINNVLAQEKREREAMAHEV